MLVHLICGTFFSSPFAPVFSRHRHLPRDFFNGMECATRRERGKKNVQRQWEVSFEDSGDGEKHSKANSVTVHHTTTNDQCSKCLCIHTERLPCTFHCYYEDKLFVSKHSLLAIARASSAQRYHHLILMEASKLLSACSLRFFSRLLLGSFIVWACFAPALLPRLSSSLSLSVSLL